MLWLSCATLAHADDSEITALTVLADPALAIPLAQLASEYSSNRHVSINIAYAPSFEQVMAIESGEEVDLLITAHPSTLNKLKRENKIADNGLETLLHMKLALIGSSEKTSPPKLAGIPLIKNLFQGRQNLLAVAIPATSSEGYYTDIALNLWRHRYGVFLDNSTVQMQNSKEIAEFVAQNKGYGFIFEPEVAQYQNLRILEKFAVMRSDIPLSAAIISGSNTKASRKFLKFLRQNGSQHLFAKHGFKPATPSAD